MIDAIYGVYLCHCQYSFDPRCTSVAPLELLSFFACVHFFEGVFALVHCLVAFIRYYVDHPQQLHHSIQSLELRVPRIRGDS